MFRLFWKKKKAYDQEGYDPDGYDREGYDRRGFDRLGVRKEYARLVSFNLLDGKTLTVDFHGCSKGEVEEILEHLLTEVKSPVQFLRLVHGYSHGTVLRDYIRTELDHPRIASVQRTFENDGVTILELKLQDHF